MADIDQLFATIKTCIRALHKLHPDKLSSRRWQVRNVTNRLRAVRPIATGNWTAPCSPCLIDSKGSADVLASDAVGNDYGDKLLSGRRRPLSLDNIGTASLTRSCNLRWHNKKPLAAQDACDTDGERRDRRVSLEEQMVTVLPPSPTLTDQQDLTVVTNLPATSPLPKTKYKPSKSSTDKIQRSSIPVAIGTTVGLGRLRKRRREEDPEVTSNSRTQTATGNKIRELKRRKVVKKTHLETDITLSDLASKFGQRKNIKDIEDSIAALATFQEVGSEIYLLQRGQLTASVDMIKHTTIDAWRLPGCFFSEKHHWVNVRCKLVRLIIVVAVCVESVEVFAQRKSTR